MSRTWKGCPVSLPSQTAVLYYFVLVIRKNQSTVKTFHYQPDCASLSRTGTFLPSANDFTPEPQAEGS